MNTRYVALASFVLSFGCGTGAPDIPPELLDAGGSNSSSYPAGPYLADVGATLENFAFTGFRDPRAASYDRARFERVAMDDYYDPEGLHHELLLLNTAAVWCQACRVEHRSLPERHEEFRPRGLVIVSALFQDAASNPAAADDLLVWTRQFETNFPMVLDPEFQLGRYASAETAPLNLIVDTRTMQILERFIGDQEAVLWPYIERELDQRGR